MVVGVVTTIMRTITILILIRRPQVFIYDLDKTLRPVPRNTSKEPHASEFQEAVKGSGSALPSSFPTSSDGPSKSLLGQSVQKTLALRLQPPKQEAKTTKCP